MIENYSPKNRILLFLFAHLLLLTACTNSTSSIPKEQSHKANTSQPIDTTKETISLHEKSKQDSFIVSKIGFIDFEKLQIMDWELCEKYLIKKGFQLYSDSTYNQTIQKSYIHSESKEILEITNIIYSDGEVVFKINLYTTLANTYNAFITSLSTSKYQFNKKKHRYELYMGSYEEVWYDLSAQVLKNKQMKYKIEYIHRIGKEISTPVYNE